jgi:hypothetical protein
MEPLRFWNRLGGTLEASEEELANTSRVYFQGKTAWVKERPYPTHRSAGDLASCFRQQRATLS